jgi:cytochrome P450
MHTQEHPQATAPSASRCPFSAAARDFAPFSDEYILNPYPFLKELRQEAPVFFKEDMNYWIVTRYQDVKECLSNRDLFSAKNVLEPVSAIYPSTGKILVDAGVKFGPALADEDLPGHGQHRPSFNTSFSPVRLRQLDGYVRDMANEKLDAIVRNGKADLVDDFAFWIPATVIFNLMKVPEADIPKVRDYVTAMAGLAWGHPSEEEQNRLAHVVVDYWNYARQLVLNLKDNLGDDFVSDYVRAHIENPEVWTLDYITSLTSNFLFAGHETTSAQLGSAFRALLENRSQWEAICADPKLIPNAIEESLRYVGSVLAWRRMTKQAVTIGGVDIPAGAKLLLMFGAANREESIFPDPDRFDVKRKEAARHVTFGFGAHTCMGAPLARMEMRVVLEELVKRLPHMNLVADQSWEYPRTTSHRGLAHVHVEWDASKNPVLADRPV